MTKSTEVRIVLQVREAADGETVANTLRSLNERLMKRNIPSLQGVVAPSLVDECGCPELARLWETRAPAAVAIAVVREFREALLPEEIYPVEIQTPPLVGDEPWVGLPTCPGPPAPNPKYPPKDPSGVAKVAHGLPAGTDRPPSFHAMQRYLGPASTKHFGGIEAAIAWGLSGGRGQGIRIADIEKAWGKHRDLANPCSTPAPGLCPPDSHDLEHHGLAVEGLLVALNDGTGIDGIASDASVQRVQVGSFEEKNVATALCTAVADLDPGDVILVETKYRRICEDGNGGECASPDLPHEISLDCKCILKRAVDKGIHVVQTAGNGGVDLGIYDPCDTDTGAILVAAGQPAIGARTSTSNWGCRINLFSWGHSVISLGLKCGLKDHWGAPGARYADFGGTSAAAAIVAGAAACLSGILKAAGKSLSPRDMRSLLVDTGYAKQKTDTSQIGVHPNLRAACLELQRRKLIPEGSVL